MSNIDFSKFFPTPNILETQSFGLDISDEAIKYIKLKKVKGKTKIDKYGEKKIPKGVVEAGEIKDSLKLEEILNSLKDVENIKAVRVSILENQIYLFRMKLQKQGLDSIRSGIEISLEYYIPIPAVDAIFDYDILEEDDQYLYLQVGAIRKDVVESYLNVFKGCDLPVLSFELEPQAIARSVIKKGDKDTYMIVDFGEKRTGIFIVSVGNVVFTSTVEVGGVDLNQSIEKHFKVPSDEAITLKKKYGLQRNSDNKEIFSVLLNSVSILRDEILKHYLYWHTHQDEDGKKNPSIKKILLCGGDSNLIGLSDYLSISIKTQVEMANVWENILNIKNETPEISFKKALSFASALGLALADFDYD